MNMPKFACTLLCAIVVNAPLHAQTLRTATPTITVNGSGNQAQVAWSQVSGILQYAVMRHEITLRPDGTVASSTPWAAVATVTGGAYSDVLPKPSVLYEYRIDGTLRLGPTVSSSVARYPAPAFTTPGNVAVTGTGTQANVSWSPGTAVVAYLVWRRITKSDGTVANLEQRTPTPIIATSFVDSVAAGNLYEYQVQSLDATYATYPSAWVRYAAPAAPAVVLTAPMVSVTGIADKATVSWVPVTGAVNYMIERTAADAAGKPIGRLMQQLTPSTTFNDVVSEPGATVTYTVTAVAANSATGPAKTLIYLTPQYTTPVGVTVAGAGGQVAISWCLTTGMAGYEIWRRTVNPDGSVTAPMERTRGGMGISSWTDKLPTPGLIYEFQVVAVGMDYRRWPSAWVRYAAGSW